MHGVEYCFIVPLPSKISCIKRCSLPEYCVLWEFFQSITYRIHIDFSDEYCVNQILYLKTYGGPLLLNRLMKGNVHRKFLKDLFLKVLLVLSASFKIRNKSSIILLNLFLCVSTNAWVVF